MTAALCVLCKHQFVFLYHFIFVLDLFFKTFTNKLHLDFVITGRYNSRWSNELHQLFN